MCVCSQSLIFLFTDVGSPKVDLKTFCGTPALPYRCCICLRAFPIHQKFISHFQKHMAINQVINCSICHEKMPPVPFQEHMAKHAEEEGQCSACGFAKVLYKRKRGCVLWLVDHECIFSVSIESGELLLECSLCNGKAFSVGPVAMTHAHMHKACSPFPCSFCKMSFSSRMDRVLHATTAHADCKRFSKRTFSLPCHLCGRRLSSIHRAKVHHKACSMVKGIFFCNACNSTFNSLSALKSHNRSVHVYDISCDYCCLICQTSEELALHLKTHHEGKISSSTTCLECGIECRNRPNLIQHMSVRHPTSIITQEALQNSGITFNKLSCAYCTEKFSTVQEIFWHSYAEHKTEKMAYSWLLAIGKKCPLCSRDCETAKAMCQHLTSDHELLIGEEKDTETAPQNCIMCSSLNWHNLVLHVFHSHKGMVPPERIFTEKVSGVCPICRERAPQMAQHLQTVHSLKTAVSEQDENAEIKED